ncbi:hypothetical protein HNY73_000930 [Argiope bruennichi]|uniref:Uncharacterized protein n=1 Tax=Argiope bruennichi TaxID=94029 RepID=A0A8T0G3E2_ARGBR|nr:hypothetical protein HNY73_000930 [Argiope bruennichi]
MQPVTKTKSADSAPCSREDGDEKQKKNRKTLAQDMKMRLSFLRRRIRTVPSNLLLSDHLPKKLTNGQNPFKN